MPKSRITTLGNKAYGFSPQDLSNLKRYLRRRRGLIEEALKQNEYIAHPWNAPRTWVMCLGVDRRTGLTKQAAVSNASGIYNKQDLKPRFRAYWELLEDLGWSPQVRHLIHGPGQPGSRLHFFVMDPQDQRLKE